MDEIPRDPNDEILQEGFWQMRKIFVGLTAVGFTEAQALQVVIQLITHNNGS